MWYGAGEKTEAGGAILERKDDMLDPSPGALERKDAGFLNNDERTKRTCCDMDAMGTLWWYFLDVSTVHGRFGV